MIKKNNFSKLFLLSLGAILCLSGNIAIETGRIKGQIAALIGGMMAVIGCYLWSREKSRAWGFALLGLLAPLGYVVIWLLEDKNRGIDAND